MKKLMFVLACAFALADYAMAADISAVNAIASNGYVFSPPVPFSEQRW